MMGEEGCGVLAVGGCEYGALPDISKQWKDGTKTSGKLVFLLSMINRGSSYVMLNLCVIPGA